MKLSEFEDHYYHLNQKIENILVKKAKEYANDEDRLFNFKQTTSLLNTNQASVCLYYDSKHIASLAKICQDIDSGIYPTKELLEEKIQDYLAYGYLLYANIIELIEQNQNIHLESPSKIGFISHVEAPRSDFGPKDDTTTVSLEKQQIEKMPTKIDWKDRSDSITRSITPTVQDDLNLTTNL